jgi:hypothetical protein
MAFGLQPYRKTAEFGEHEWENVPWGSMKNSVNRERYSEQEGSYLVLKGFPGLLELYWSCKHADKPYLPKDQCLIWSHFV